MRRQDGGDNYVAVAEGFLVVQKDRTTVLTRSAERPEEIDAERAKRSKERAEQRLQEHGPDIDLLRAQASLQRALARLKVQEYVELEK
jgi:F-type H+-transporting ATPase subunit epsilon